MKNGYQLLLTLLLLLGCLLVILLQPGEEHPKPVQTKETENKYEVSLLFEHDGCKVYRFYDFGAVYYVKCAHEASAYSDTRTAHGSGRVCNVHTQETDK